MLSTLLDRMSSTPRSVTGPDPELGRASPVDSIPSATTPEASDPQPSSFSTPPTSIGDGASISSTTLMVEAMAPIPAEDLGGRSRRQRTSVATYNVKKLCGTAIHAPRKYLKNPDGSPVSMISRRPTISDDTLISDGTSPIYSPAINKDTDRLLRDGIDALDLQWSVKKLPRSKSQLGLASTANMTNQQLNLKPSKTACGSSEKIGHISKRLGVLGKRSRTTMDEVLSTGLGKVKGELRRLQDTPEFAKIDPKPVIHEVWSNGKLVVEERPRKKRKVGETEPKQAAVDEEPKPVEKKKIYVKKQKTWLLKGLYAGQKGNLDWFENQPHVKKDINADNVDTSKAARRSILPLPLWYGQRLLHIGRDFKLPFDVCSPMPPGQPKPDEWRKTSSNRFVGGAAASWKRMDIFDSFSSKCVCTKEYGCDERCQNRIMLYECDDENCAVGKACCGNRAFAELQERRKGGGKFRIGVEVLKTPDRGYGVRSNRCFEPNQIIVEYTGEIITEDECDRRMNEDYKNNECYYLMSFDQNMILDGTKGSIARFVNHSCKPNCRMVKWVVAGKPRMALFAGDNPIMTADELTYDYNFDPFSAKNVQECRCGSDNCRGVLGPKPKDPKLAKEAIKDAMKAGAHAGKRKLKELLAADDDEAEATRSPKKRKMKPPKGLKKSSSSANLNDVKQAVKSVKKNLSAQILRGKQTLTVKRKTVVETKRTFAGSTPKKHSPLKTYGKSKVKVASRNPSMTFVARDDSSATPEKIIGGMTAATLTAPLDVLKTRLQSDFYQTQLQQSRLAKGISPHAHLSAFRSGLLHFHETFQILGSVHRVEGWRALFKGLGPNLIGVVPARSMNFFVVGNGKRMIAEYGNDGVESAWVVLCAAATAGIATSTATNPIWLIKTRLQLDKNVFEKTGGKAKRMYRNSWDCIKQTVRQEGVRGLYKGMSASYLGVTESALQWVLYEQMKKSLEKREARIVLSGRERSTWDNIVSWTGGLGAAGSAKLVAALATYPHEVARTRLRQAPLENGQPKYTSLVQCFKIVCKEEGMVALYGGLTPHLLRTVPSAAIMFGIYEGILKLLHAERVVESP
ncbi:hypothetical protein BJ875DRAFT_535534 [Amylocarpus encephaloides]|uniref:Histone-lysine N-methyltransferase ASH1L n=1 Tax=Amylocarpus encephaloides TaxID=45428 RepID=A0A9P7YGF8_9HELO|nr:hypothetical protein BJ875DRAFT_535534 [Amylocarpus encephaloides]